MQALITTPTKTASLSSSHPLPKISASLNPDRLLVRTVAVALNPTDWKSIASGFAPPSSVVGCDYAGIVEEVGPGVKKPFKKGDRVAGFVHGCSPLNPTEGAFAEYIIVIGDLQIVIPDSLSFEEAATLGVGITTVGQALYQSLGLELPAADAAAISASSASSSEPTDGDKTVLVYGGSTATGTLAIQFAKLSGYHVLTTCSAKNFDLVRGYGADAVFDYGDANAPAEIRKYTSDSLRYVFDTISTDSSVKFCDEAIGSAGGKLSTLLRVQSARSDVVSRHTLGYTATGEEKVFGEWRLPASKEDREFAEMFWEVARGLFARGLLRAHPVQLREGGLGGVLGGLEDMREGRVSGVKLVYKV
ncbi:GroES-like protein [Aspergillus californicus]